ncbi:MAG: sulfatase-like hydrolase/transferase [Candidatus Binatia bacterium]|nr:sulfatase-like hydrolase/transferase [Candidatus Binatia bacterium]
MAAAQLILPAGCTRKPAEAKPQNIVLVITDDQSWDSIGYASGGRVKSPELDGLAASGTTFDAAYCNSMPCVPSRASLTTGVHHHRWPQQRRTDKVVAIRPGAWTWAHALRAAGYSTALVGKMHYMPRQAPHGFDYMALCEHWPASFRDKVILRLDGWRRSLSESALYEPMAASSRKRGGFSAKPWAFAPEHHRISWVRDRAIEFLDESRATERPFALTVSFSAPHSPYDPAPEFAALYDPKDVEVPTDGWADMVGIPESVRNVPAIFTRDKVPTKKIREMLASYRALVSQVDAAVGAIAKHVDPADTLVVFCSDHGDYLGKRGQLLKDPGIPFDDVAQVPMFAYGAGVPEGRMFTEPVSLVDLAPTFLTAAGLEPPAHLDGIALQDRFAGAEMPADRPVYCFGRAGFDMIRVGELKYFRSHDGSVEMLFDVDQDPRELRNIAQDPAQQTARAELAARLAAVLERAPEQAPGFGRHSVRLA